MLISLYHLGLTLHTGAESPAAPPPSGISLDANSNASGRNTKTLSWSHAVGPGSNRILVVTVGGFDYSLPGDAVVSGVTYGGAPLTKAAGSYLSSYLAATSIWYLVNPSVGSDTIVVTYTGTAMLGSAGATSLFGVDQSSPVNMTANHESVDVSDAVSGTTLTDKCWTFDSYVAQKNSAMTFVSWGAGQTQNWQYDTTYVTYYYSSGSSRKEDVPLGAVSHSVTVSASASIVHALAAFAPA